MIATVLNNDAYRIVWPSWAIVIGCIWALIVIAVMTYAFVAKPRSTKAAHDHH